MGESSATPLKLQFDRRVRLDFRGATITSDAGLLACPELDAALGLTETANDYIHESRTGRNVQHPTGRRSFVHPAVPRTLRSSFFSRGESVS